MGEELMITIREKGQYETFSAYLEDIKKSVEKQNNNIIKDFMKKDSEIAELKAKIAELKSKISSLETEAANVEKSENDTNLFAAVNDVLFKVEEGNSKTDELISRLDKFNKKLGRIEEDSEEIMAKISELSIDPTKLEELEDLIKDNNAMIVDLKSEAVVPFREKEAFAPAADLNTDFNLNSNEEENEIDNPQSMFDQVENTSVEEENKEEEVANPFDNAFNNNEEQEQVQEEVKAENENEEVAPSVVPFVNNPETIAPAADVINSITPQGTTVEETNEQNNVIEETTPETNNSEEPINNEVDENTEKVVATEEVSQEYVDGAMQSMDKPKLESTAIKAVRMCLNAMKEKKETGKSFSLKSFVLNNAELPVEFADHFVNNLDNNQEVRKAM